MKTVRNNRYEENAGVPTGSVFLVLATILGSAVVIAAAIVICVLVFLPKKSACAATILQAESQVSSETSSAPSKPAVDMSDVNPNAATAISEGELAYQSLYPELYVPIVEKIPVKDGDKVIYLTYDDGPSEETERLLDILDQEGVKATFFVMAQGKSLEDCKKWLKMIVDRGHAIGVHTYSHQYKEIYASPQAFLEDFKKMHDLIYEASARRLPCSGLQAAASMLTTKRPARRSSQRWSAEATRILIGMWIPATAKKGTMESLFMIPPPRRFCPIKSQLF